MNGHREAEGPGGRRPLSVYVATYGCRANHYDSEAVKALVESSGGRVVASAVDADVAVFNSCAVTGEAVADLRKGVRRATRARPDLRTLIMGCASALDDGSLAALPGVEAVLAGADFAGVASALGLSAASVEMPGRQSATRAVLRIQDGCDEHCTFCATTLARGANRSRQSRGLIEEATALADHHPEIVLTGIHIGSWGRDIGLTLGDLVQDLIRAVPQVRFRLSSVEVTELDSRLLEAFGEADHLAPHLHAPLQSGSSPLLRRMGRHWYSAESYREGIESLTRRHAVFGLGADVIAGFPGESESDHEATLSIIRDLPFTYLHVFPFSLRPGTAAEKLSGHNSPQTVERRARALRELGREKERLYAEERLGGWADVVSLRGPAAGGLTGDYLSVRLDGGALDRPTRFTGRLAGSAGELLAVVPRPPNVPYVSHR
ncbi:MAG: MiaB/RimO family radical SAM methylthiotransferase [Gemmatimonadota bacterium]